MLREHIQFAFEDIDYRAAALRQWFSARLRHAPSASVLVNGSPKTGTTWMRNLFISLPGYRLQGNVGSNIKRYLNASPGDVFHGHHFHSTELQAYLDTAGIRRILMLRDPRDQTVSRMFHVRRDEGHPWHKQFLGLDDDEALLACIEGRDDNALPGVRAMAEISESWQAGDPAAIVVRYEDLLEDPERIMAKVFDKMGIPVTARLVRAIVTRNRFRRQTVGRRFFQKSRESGEADAGSHYRKGISGDWKNYFQPQHKQRFKQLAGEILIAWGYETDLDW
jgi:hypothetical protein